MASYWVQRHERAKQKLTDKGIAKTNRQLKKYYQTAMKKVIEDFEATYDKLLAARAEGREPTPADLYKLDKYWQMQAQLKNELQKLGDKEAELLSKEFTEHWLNVYEASALTSDESFSKVDKSVATQMINQIWCADGKTWSQRIWGNIDRLQETLNESLISCVVTGKKTTELKKQLQERFGVSYRRANTLVRTEMSHIQNQAAKQRYQDTGITKYEFLGREESDGCGHSPDCHKLDGQVFLLAEMKVGVNAPPMHPNCRCSVAPVVELDDEREKQMEEIIEEKNEIKCPVCGKTAAAEDGYLMCKSCMNKLKKDSYVESLVKEGHSWKDALNASIDDDYWEKNILHANIPDLYKLYKKQQGIKTYGRRGDNSIYINVTRGVKRKHDVVELREGMERLAEIENLSPLEQDKHFAVCIDCGNVFLKKTTRSNQAKRCPDCQDEYRKKYKAEKEAERRKRKKKK